MSMKNFSDTIGNRSRDVPVCSAMPQPLRQRVPLVLLDKQLTINEVANRLLIMKNYVIISFLFLSKERLYL
jgi:hypothetical protein